MSKIIPFKPKVSKDVIEIMNLANDIDAVVNQHLNEGMEYSDIIGVMANRLGALLKCADSETKKHFYYQKILEHISKAAKLSF